MCFRFCVHFQIETFGMKELSTINAKKVLNNGGLKVVLGVAGTIYSDGNDPLELNTSHLDKLITGHQNLQHRNLFHSKHQTG